MGQEQIGDYKLGRLKGEYVVTWCDEETGRRRRFRLHISDRRPESEALAALADFVRRREAAKLDNKPVTIGAIFKLYLEDRRREGKKVKTIEYHWRVLRTTFEPLLIEDIEAPLRVDGEERTICHKYALERSKLGKSRDTIWTELLYIRTALNWAYNRNLIKRAPFVWIPKKGAPRDVVLSEEEVLRILENCVMPHVRLFVLLAITTSARKAAILELTWDRVDLDRRTIDFRKNEEKSILDSGGEKGRAIIEFGEILEIALREAKHAARTKHVIEWNGQAVKSVRKALDTAIEKAGLKGRRIGSHVFRHSSATWLADEGIDMRKIQRMLGHKHMSVTETIYAKHSRGYLADAARVIDSKIRKSE